MVKPNCRPCRRFRNGPAAGRCDTHSSRLGGPWRCGALHSRRAVDKEDTRFVTVALRGAASRFCACGCLRRAVRWPAKQRFRIVRETMTITCVLQRQCLLRKEGPGHRQEGFTLLELL